ncbi:hypothetical protein SAMN04489806_1240 [Paramicrobacterium humi]|uniref:Glycoside hydrolase family 127 protein n=1 Tax=Paramicrobacterium humi TaxID=640635 RepID=A0A1H4KPD0_9MICO|nr:beta-L-arabinofuranosidase domain-containing protein [Microbacterium humi]SEB59968.1 hypothetical protein SAMN04489806_1240 [Microbacterium humi]
MTVHAIDARIATPVAPSTGALRPLALTDVRIDGGFWGGMQELNARAIIDNCEAWMERVGWIGNFDAAVEGRLPADRTGREFADSDVYKLLEAMAWEIGRAGSENLDARFRAIVARIAPVQEADGYLNTHFGRPGQAPRYSDLEWGHELYCYGHLLQAAVARGRTRGDDEFVELARRAADHVCEVFGPEGILRVGGHPEIELGLVEFGRYTGQRRYIDQAALFVERRGHGTLADIEFGRSYFQDDVPVRDTTVFAGHAVRALYLAAGAVDVAVETGDTGLADAVEAAYARTVARRTYLTGGMGSHHEGESFGVDFELPSDRAYSETCAGIASVMLSHRLLLQTGDSRYGDLIERTLYNVVATSPAADGCSFYYTNTLHQRVPGTVPPNDTPSPRASSSLRAPWFEVSCCPTNVARTLASLGAYVATTSDDGVQLHQYVNGSLDAHIDAGTVRLRLDTDYPVHGSIRVEILESPDAEWALSLRVPAWAEGATLAVGADAATAVETGTVTVRRAFAAGDVVQLELPMAARWTEPDPRIDALRGQRAVERGPLVMCLESIDAPELDNVDEARVTGTLRDIEGAVSVGLRRLATRDGDWPYSTTAETRLGDEELVPLVPYNTWANRGPSTMRVWLPRAEPRD